MPDDQAVAAPDAQEQYIQQMLRQLQGAPPQAATGARAQVAQPSSVTGLLGYALGGGASGAVPMSADESEAAGNRSLLNFGLNLLANSGYRTDRPTIGQLIGGGIGAAQQSLGQSEYMKAARGQAQQDYAAQQQELQIARMKEALPLLTLQQNQRRLAGLAGVAGGGNTSIATAGDVPFALNNPLNIKFAGQPGAVNTNGFAAWKTPEEGQAATDALFGKYAEGGINTLAGFISKWAPPSENDTAGYIANVAKATGIDPGAKIDFRDPAVRAKVQAAMAVQEGNKNSLRPTAPVATTAAPTAPAPAPTIAPAAAPPPAAIPANQAPATAGGDQVAGPGAPSNIPIKPPGPAVPGNVAALKEGMVQAGADPTTLAATGRGVASTRLPVPSDQPPVPATLAQAGAPGGLASGNIALDLPPGAPGVVPTSPNAPAAIQTPLPQAPMPVFEYKPRAIPAGVLPGGDLTPQEQSVVADARRTYAEALQTAKFMNNPDAAAKLIADAKATFQGTLDKELTARTGRTQSVIDLTRDLTAKDFEQQVAQHKDLLTDWTKGNDQQRQAIIAREAATHAANLEMQKEGFKIQTEADRKVIDAVHEQGDAANDTITHMQMFRQLSDAAGEPGFLAQYPELRTWMSKLGLASPAEMQKWSAQEALAAAAGKLTLATVKTAGLGKVTDKDLEFVQRQVPQGTQPQMWRNAQAGFILTLNQRQKEYVKAFDDNLSQGMKVQDAKRAAQESLGPVFPEMPALSDKVAKQDQINWAATRLQPGSFYVHPVNGLSFYNPNNATAPQ